MEPVHAVAVIGFGPSGAVAAGLLGQAGLKTFVCDRQRDVYDKPRAISLDHEIMRVFQALEVAGKIEPFTEAFTPSEYFGVDGQLIKRFTTVEPPYPLGYVPSLVFTQPRVEEVLRARVRSLADVTLSLGVQLTGLVQEADQVVLTLQQENGRSETVRARYVIGCDGASSLVRSLAGMQLDDLGFDEPWLVADLRVNERGLEKLPTSSVQYCEPARPCTYVIGPGNHRRWEISLNPGEDPRDMETPAGTWKVLRRWLNPEDAELWRQASYRFHALVATRWRAGRVFIAGDAAHQQPPFLGQGMCQGVRDVANLSWKLVAVLQGRANAALLDTYGVERRQHVVDLTTRIKGIGAVICERDVARARARDAALLAACGGVVPNEPRQNIQPALEAGCLAASGHAARGTIFPQPWITTPAGPRRFDEMAGQGWRLVLAPGVAPDAACPPDLVRRLGLTEWRLDDPQLERDGVLAAWFARHACKAALVRPDHYVYGVATTLADLQAEWSRLRMYFN